ncbi:MAG: hypothetical protein HUN04_12420 [Desulfobacter sp.]|nr:MAG: hypothetical protein HUN04_12420 [Desulfobacter sp.]
MKNVINYSLLFCICLLFNQSYAYSFNEHKYECSQNINSIQNLKYLSSHRYKPFLKYYENKNNDERIKINNIKFHPISYIFWKDKYVGYAIYINEKSKGKKILDLLYTTFNHPHEQSHTFKTWYTNDQIIIFTKFSLHQSRIIFLCKNMGLDLKKVFDQIKIGKGPH